MACFSLPCCTGSFLTPDRLQIRYFRVYRGLCTSSIFLPLEFNQCYKLQNEFIWNKNFECYGRKSRVSSFRFPYCCKIEPLVSRTRGDRKSDHYGKGESNRLKKRFSLRLRPRLRLFAMRMKRASFKSVLNELGMFIRKNNRTVAFSTSFSIVFTLCFMFLKLTSLPPAKVVPYSDLIASLQNGYVAKVLVEEGSRRIYYNMKSQVVENDKVLGEESQQVVDVSNLLTDKDIDEVGNEDTSRSGQIPVLNKLKKISTKRASIPEWQYSTRKLDHDEKFLVSLMREKGVTFSSAPQSVLMSMRSTLITVITLWIPLIPLMWLLYRQLSAANSPAKKRKPNSQTVGFEDVQGVDSAKVELMEVIIS